MTTLSYDELAPGLVVLFHDHGASPSDEEWRGVLSLLSRIKSEHGKATMLVFTDGPSPNSRQRRLAQESAVEQGEPPLVAVVSAHAIVRGVVTAASWLGLTVKAFSPTEVPSALAYLGHVESLKKVAAHCAQTTKKWRCDAAMAIASEGVSGAA